MTSVRPSTPGSRLLLQLPSAIPWVALLIVTVSVYVAWRNHFGDLQQIGAAVICCCAVLTPACIRLEPAAIILSAIGGGVALGLTSREYFAFWGASTALLVTSALLESEHRDGRLPRAAVTAVALGALAALVGPAHDPLTPWWPAAVALPLVLLLKTVLGWARHTRDVERRAAGYLRRARDSEASAAELTRRTELAQELHDSLSHHIAAIAVQAEAGQVARERETLVTIADLAREALGELETVLFDLRSPEGDSPSAPDIDLSLIDTRLAAPLRRTGVTVDVEVTTAETAPETRAAIYRMVQEALTNALRYADATRVSVCVADRDGQVHLLVQDNGIGITTEAPSSGQGMGLAGIRDRATRLGGAVEVGPADPQGTLIQVHLPRTHA